MKIDNDAKAAIRDVCATFEKDLLKLGYTVDHHSDFVGLLRRVKDNKVVGVFYGEEMDIAWEDEK